MATGLLCATVALATIALTLALPRAAVAQDPVPSDVTGVTVLPQEPIVGRTLTAQVTVTGDPTGFVLQWLRCGVGKPPCSTVVGTGSSYVIAGADLDRSLAVRVSLNGEERLRSALTAPVYAIAPQVSVSIVGEAEVGKTLAARSTVQGEPAPALAYQWFRCAGDPPLCTEPIAGATADTYLVAGTDVARPLAVRVTASNLDGEAASLALTGVVQQAPTVTELSIVGTAAVGETLTANFVVDGFPTPAVAYQWRRCDAQCNDIGGATEPSYEIEAGDVGRRLALRVTATNGAGQVVGRSDPTGVVPEPPRLPNFDESGSNPVTTPDTPIAFPRSPLSTPPLRYLRPFPVVRMKGRLVSGGARVTLLRVTAPRGSKVLVVCRRAGCPLRRRSVGRGRIRALERRFLPAGMRITIRVWKPGMIGKHVRIAIRDGRVPSRRDACLLPGDKRPHECPAP